MFDIDANLLYQAMMFFNNCGYEFITAPYVVDKKAVEHTLPEGREAYPHANYGFYVGSAEQSIYHMLDKCGRKNLPKRCLAITPCQRNEEVLDESHLEIFLKIELISFDLGYSHKTIMEDVLDFFKMIGTENVTYVMQDDNVSYDINVNNIEVGSYGYRWFRDVLVSYGTGLALPRYSYAVSKGK